MDLSKYKAEWVNISDINVDNRMFQFRKEIAPESVAELVRSMAEDGQKFPVILWGRSTGEKVVVAGLRRLTAAIANKWESILAIAIPEADASYEEMLSLNFIENIERKTLNNLDLMLACQKLSQQGKKSNVQIGKLIGKSEKQVRAYIKVASAPADIQEKVRNGEVPIDSLGKGGVVVDHEAAPKPNKSYVKQAKKSLTAVLKFNIQTDDPAIVKAHINDITNALKQLQRSVFKSAKRTAKSASTRATKTSIRSPLAGEGQGERGVLDPTSCQGVALHSFSGGAIKGIVGGSEIFKQCEAELARMQKELDDSTKNEQEKSSLRAQLQKSKTTFEALKKEFGIETPPANTFQPITAGQLMDAAQIKNLAESGDTGQGMAVVLGFAKKVGEIAQLSEALNAQGISEEEKSKLKAEIQKKQAELEAAKK